MAMRSLAMVAAALCGLGVPEAAAQFRPVTISNLSRPTECAEDRNVVMLFGGRPERFALRATHPVYDAQQTGCDPITTNCTPGDPGFAFTPARLILYVDDTTVVEAIREERWWRARGMTARSGDLSLASAHRVEVRRKVEGTSEFAEVLSVYADGTVSLKPHPRTGTTAVCTGGVLVVGPVQVAEGRHFAAVSAVTYLPGPEQLTMEYAVGGSASVVLASASRTAAVARVTVAYDTRARPFAAFRSMFVSDGVADTARARFSCGGDAVFSGDVTDAPDALADSAFFSRVTRSEHAESAPNLRVNIDTPARSLPDFNADGRPDLVFQDTTPGGGGAARVWHMDCLRTLSTADVSPGVPQGWRIAAAADFDGDRAADLLLRDTRGGGSAIWLMDGSVRDAVVQLPGVADAAWRIVGAADFDRDGDADIAWRNARTGDNLLWIMQGTARQRIVALPSMADMEWQVGGAGDFDGDGSADLLWRNCRTGQNAVWRLLDGQRLVTEVLPALTVRGWHIGEVFDLDADGRAEVVWRNHVSGENLVWFLQGLALREALDLDLFAGPFWRLPGDARAGFPAPGGDFNGDCSADVLYRNAATGENWIWRLRGTTALGTTPLPRVTGPWRIGAVQDLIPDEIPDVVWQNTTSGRLVVWFMAGTTVRATLSLLSEPDTAWRVVGAGDFDGDAYVDLVWRNSDTGANRVWRMQGVNLEETLNLPAQPSAAWQIQAVADFNLDGRADLLWRNTATGADALWLMRGATRLATVVLPGEPDTGWTVGSARDFDRDGDADILWRHGATGQQRLWIMDRAAFQAEQPMPTVEGPDTVIGG